MSYLDVFVSDTRELPKEFERQFETIQMLNRLIAEAEAKLNALRQEVFAKVSTTDESQLPQLAILLGQYRAQERQVAVLLDERVDVAEQTEDMVHGYLHRLHSDVQHFEDEMEPDEIPADPFATGRNERLRQHKKREQQKKKTRARIETSDRVPPRRQSSTRRSAAIAASGFSRLS
ncbi:MAG: hypothetical protein MHM6MM_007972 [Cercozoa sp. M6MM]